MGSDWQRTELGRLPRFELGVQVASKVTNGRRAGTRHLRAFYLDPDVASKVANDQNGRWSNRKVQQLRLRTSLPEEKNNVFTTSDKSHT